MFEVQKTDEFDQWLAALRDQRAIAKIVSRIERLAMGNAGDVKPSGRELASCASTMGRVTACTTSK